MAIPYFVAGTTYGINFIKIINDVPEIVSKVTPLNGLRGNTISSVVYANNKLAYSSETGVYSFNPFQYLNYSSEIGLEVLGEYSLNGGVPVFNSSTEIIEVKIKTYPNWNSKSKLRCRVSGEVNYEFEVSENPIRIELPQFGEYEVAVYHPDYTYEENFASVLLSRSKPFWKESIFQFLIILLLLGLIALWIYQATKRRYRKKQNQEELKNKMTMLQLKALQTQMNPHFLFNTMNSIQHYILNNDVKQANSFSQSLCRIDEDVPGFFQIGIQQFGEGNQVHQILSGTTKNELSGSV